LSTHNSRIVVILSEAKDLLSCLDSQ
jgi:hypothetical protein